jgi:site-specific recombinase XerD
MGDKALALFGQEVLEGEVLPARVTVLDKARAWAMAFELWLDGRGSDKTRQAYRRWWQEFLAFTQKMPWDVNKTDVALWVDALRRKGLKPASINQAVAALSSFYEYAMNEYEITMADGRTVTLAERNPAAAKSLRTQVAEYSSVISLDGKQAKALLEAIELLTPQGLRDFALFAFYLATGRRNSEIRTLQKKNFRERAGGWEYYWHGKRKEGWDEVPEDIWLAINVYLRAAGRAWEDLDDEAYIFTALSTNARRMRNVSDNWDPHGQALSLREVGRLIKVYARKAGLDATKVHPHVLRHTVAYLMNEMGASLREIQQRLTHGSLDMTDRYIGAMKKPENTYWKKAKALYDLPDNPMVGVEKRKHDRND